MPRARTTSPPLPPPTEEAVERGPPTPPPLPPPPTTDTLLATLAQRLESLEAATTTLRIPPLRVGSTGQILPHRRPCPFSITALTPTAAATRTRSPHFTEVMKAVVTCLRCPDRTGRAQRPGVRTLPWLDDFAFFFDNDLTHTQARAARDRVFELFHSLGLAVAPDKGVHEVSGMPVITERD
ncbi:hypothetical protein AB1Y20_004735 [Prymnesium parvum]|uniref:Reverse transcriptase domain-containing protein n=1 Tax=Prymnesium parvum TaxID=97485 RepID=A0AB34J053_PRYPA